jgi:hypothetical protein
MGILIFLNITLIVLLIILVLYIIKNSNFNIKGLLSKKDKINNIKNIKIEQSIENNLEFNKDERVFVGRFVSDEEYNQIVKNKKRSAVKHSFPITDLICPKQPHRPQCRATRL